MYKLQVVLIPPGANSGGSGIPAGTPTTENSQILPSNLVGNGSSIKGSNRSELVGNGAAASNLFMSSFISNYMGSVKTRKFLHFTKPSHTLLALSQEIIDKCQKIYPNLERPVEIDTLQDANECDLDPDFLVKDVFNVDNTVRAVLRTEMEFTTSEPETAYSVSNKKRKLSRPSSGSQPYSNVLRIAKKRPHALRNGTSMRVSTPLANQIYPPRNEQINSDYEDEEVGDRSVLPPPQPQSPPIRISSGFEIGKKIASNENTVSRSETVDPDKSRQHRLLSGTPMRSPRALEETPNGPITIPGQKVMLEPASANKNMATPVATNKRITSGMLRIPEPKISEIEEELRQGPASPSAELPAKPNRIPMKKPYGASEINASEESSDAEQEFRVPEIPSGLHEINGARSSYAARQTSIADNNGSPMKDGKKLGDVNLAQLPDSRMSDHRKSSLESKVESLIKNASTAASLSGISEHNRQGPESLQATRKANFTDDEDEVDEEKDTPADPDETVRVNYLEPNTSFHKSELLSMLRHNDVSMDFNPVSRHQRIDGKEFADSDPSNLQKNGPNDTSYQRSQRTAARKAARLLSSGRSRTEPQSSSDDSSGIETELSENDSVAVMEKNALRKINIHPLKERVVGREKDSTRDASTAMKTTDRDDVLSRAKSGHVVNGKMEDIDESGTPGTNNASKPTASPKTKKDAAINSSKKTTVNKSVAEKSAFFQSPSKTISKNLEKAISPPPANNIAKKLYQTPEFVEDSDDESSTPSSILQPQPLARKKVPPSVLKRREEAERRRQEKEEAKKLKAQENATKKLEREAKKQARDEEVAKRKSEREAKKKQKEEEMSKKRAERDAKNNSKDSNSSKSFKVVGKVKDANEAIEKTPAEQGTSRSSELEKPSVSADASLREVTEKNKATIIEQAQPKSDFKLEELRRKYLGESSGPSTESKSPVVNTAPAPRSTGSYSSEISEESEDDDSSGDSSGDQSSEESSKRNRRGVVDTPKGEFRSVSSKTSKSEYAGVEAAPQSTQKTVAESSSPVKVPVTRMMEYSSPNSTVMDQSDSVPSNRKVKQHGRSLSSLSDLASRGVPEVKEPAVPTKITQPQKDPKTSDSSNEEMSDDDDSGDSNSDNDDSSSDSSDDKSNFISARSASQALGKKKSKSGFASLIKDSKKK
ncbi:LAMI_0H14576g1_1 [Lachancea mirantina]|uniref:LAMI_0H14576g1_1 n=1 Tax=Lachancea mirantina TaxID=1230905 RepID=A0A1G4KIK5_9SACH|nr:LAMI_0H14576g1_1 [Lachancea mirantina]